MYAIATFLVVAAITLIFTQLATGALIATGVPSGVATFQARSRSAAPASQRPRPRMW
jgi:uncharacterized MnhB-related membrane protein